MTKKIKAQVLELQLPWRILSQKLVKLNESGMVLYMSTFENSQIKVSLNCKKRSLKTLTYENLNSLNFLPINLFDQLVEKVIVQQH
jgi:hypothetical protein